MDTYINVIDKLLEKSADMTTPNGALCGNGDLSVIMDNDGGDLILRIAKCDFWKFTEGNDNDGGIKAVASVRLGNIDLKDYHVVQYMKKGLISCNFGDTELEIFVAPQNKIYLEIRSPQKSVFPSLNVEMSDDCGAKIFKCSDNGLNWYMRKFDGKGVLFESAVALCVRRYPTVAENGIKTVRFCFAAVTDFESTGYAAKAIELVLNSDYDDDKKKTERYWSRFFSASSVNIPDKVIEKQYNGSLYLLGCCMGNVEFPPGLYGNFLTGDNALWHGDYHLNYNYEAPFYCVFSSNHPELAKGYMKPITDFMPKAEKFASEFLGCKGVYFPVGIGPKGIDLSAKETSKEHGRLFLGQKSNAAYAAVIPVMMWYSTYDEKYALDNLYPYLYKVAEFWNSYLVKENGRYVIKDDAVHEVPYYRDNFAVERYGREIHAVNNILSLALVRMVLKCVIDIEKTLKTDEDEIPRWQEILDNLSDYPTFIKHGKRCFRYTEKGIGWVKNNSLCIQHIYPASQIGLSSDKRLLKTARNTYFINDRRLDANGSCSYLPCGARLGVSPEYLIKGIKMNMEKFLLPNMLFYHESGCIEHLTTVPATINEMLMQSHDGVIRIFPCWDMKDSASFENLRADGAFLVSSCIKKRKIGYIKIKSLAGRVCRVQVPDNVKIDLRTQNGQKIKYKKHQDYIEFNTLKDSVYSII